MAELADFGAAATLFTGGGVRLLEFRPIDNLAGNDELRRLGKLESTLRLDLRNTLIDDDGLPALYGLKSLEVLKLSPLRVSTEGASELRRRLPFTDVRPDAFFPRDSLPALNRLVRDGAVEVRDTKTGFDVMSAEPDTTRFSLWRRAGLTDANLPDLFLAFPRLSSIYVSRARGLTDKSVSVLAEHQQLRSVSLSGTAISEQGARALDRAMPRTRISWAERSGGLFGPAGGKSYQTGQLESGNAGGAR